MTATTPQPNILPSLGAKIPSLSDRLTSLLNRLQPAPEVLVFFSALMIGGGAGLAIVLFRSLISLFHALAFVEVLGYLSQWGAWTLASIPPLGGLLIGILRWWFPTLLGQDLTALLSNTRVQPFSPLRSLVKMLAAAISLGTGASLGPEGPSVEIGSSVGVLLGQTFQVSRERYRLLLGAGAAAGFAAGFNAPIAGVFFAIEVILGTRFATPAASLILLSAVISSLIAQSLLGAHPAFDLPTYQFMNSWECLNYFGLGILASFVSIIYRRSIRFAQVCFQGELMDSIGIGKLPSLIQPLIGGIIVGLLALKLPQILGIGYGVLEVILQGEQFSLQFLCVLLVAKLVVTAICLGSGLVGGIFAPAMFLRACLGGAYGNFLLTIWPNAEIAPPPAYALVGMAAVLAGSVKAPLTAILLLFEMTRNYLIILPLMAAVGISVWVVDLMQSDPSNRELNLPQMGVNLQNQDEMELLRNIAVSALMSRDYFALPASMPLIHAGQTMLQNKCHTALVVNNTGQLVGVVTLADIRRKITQIVTEQSQSLDEISRSTNQDSFQQTLEEICTTEVLYTYEDESVATALERMGTRGLYLLPVVDKDNPRTVVGIIQRNQVELASNLVMTQAALAMISPQEPTTVKASN
ncbi:chloride channel protein [Thermocoleostomius sinensis]|uniref:Chloride channel protein n=1 Tax=Thermocoleostomius sinensis A174 TaxID=2016057 RepID=A0A9E8Z864_9CYAN|nr:chloride channel protein [Thermocoleostomius sinensis]WAL58269.1 chloride channel protein [Thermocoleostomius sinensis A174]